MRARTESACQTLSTYAALADEEWQGKLCLRTSKKVYNQSLVAMMIANYGEAETEKVVRGWVENLAAPVFSSDTKVIEAIAAGQCDVGIVNSYYLGRLVDKDPNYPVKIFFANQSTDGVHVNISGAGVTKSSGNVEAATRLIEWLATGDAQQQFAGVNIEYPLLPSTKVSDLVAQWGTFKPQLINVGQAGELQTAAVKLMDRVGYN
ncbi:MAG: extracellular solute-binding protein [Pseudomonadota bacterium]